MITALRPGRTKALIQRKRRKAHIASMGDGDWNWLTACNREVRIIGSTFALLHEAVDQIDDVEVCKTCAALYATADEFYDRGYTAGYEAALKEIAQ